jgi:DNA-binding CsgD family transcriptional regulator
MTSAEEHLALAAEATSDPVGRAEIALVLGRALYAQGDSERAAGVFNDGLRQLADSSLDEQGRELHDRLRSGLLISAANVPGLQAEALRLSAEVMDERSDGVTSRSRRHLLAQATVNAAFSGQPADVVIDLATQAWDEGRLLEQETTSDLSWLLVTGALCLAGALELSLEAAEAAAADARRLGAPLAFATASFMRVLPQFWRGDIDGALADLELARDARRYGWRQYVRSAAAQYSLCLIEKGELERADEVLLEDVPLAPPYDGEDAIRLYVLAELRRAQGRYEEAFNIALSAGAAGEATLTNFGYAPWRSPAVHAALALGRLDRARELTEEQLERAQRTGIVRERIRALRLAGLVKGGKAGLEQLRAAVVVGEASPPRLETIYALIDLGSALRRANERTAARPPLERAADLARRGGATVLFERARVELAATGARPRREVLLSGPESLTPSERRIAELAAHGSSNREIAGALFITPKTVEYHLRNAYRKLDIQGRAELAGALGS